jgi:hypothetical protein
VLDSPTDRGGATKPKEMRQRALEVLKRAAEECQKPEGLDLLLTAEQLIIAADDVEEMAVEKIKPGAIIGERVGGEPTDEARHFYVCPTCGQAVDMRNRGAVLHHQRKGHQPLPSN